MTSRSEYICDFCSEPDVAWSYPARDFVGYESEGIVGESVGAWAACEECHRLIESGDRVGLTARSIALLIVSQPELVEFKVDIENRLGTVHDRFFGSRTEPGFCLTSAGESDAMPKS